MEDILSSIKRIIAEDSEATLAGPRVKRSVGLSPLSRLDQAGQADEDEVLELTDPVAVEPAEEPAPVTRAPAVQVAPPETQVDQAPGDAKPAKAKAAEAQPAEAQPAEANSAEARPAEARPATRKAAEPKAAEVSPTLVSPTTAEASRSSLAALSALIVKPETAGSDTLEGLVREMLKPMLADWLDANLPEIVERQVAQEIARISARG